MSLPRMSLHIGDYKKDTGHLGAAEHGAYLMLTMHYWATGGLPGDDAQLARIACMSDRAWKVARPTMAAFFQSNWKHKRIDRELADAQAKYDRRALAGKKGGDAKAAAKQRPSIATPPPSEIASTPNPNPNPTDKKDTAATAAAMVAKFNEFKEAFPKRKGANPWEPAAKKFGKLVLSGVDPDLMISAARRYAAEAANVEPQYVAQAITWLNQGRHNDYPEKTAVRAVELDGFYAEDGSPELDAWDAHYRLTKGINAPRDNKFGWRFPSRFPPEAA